MLAISCLAHRYPSGGQWFSCGSCDISVSPCSSPVLPQAPKTNALFISAIITFWAEMSQAGLGLGGQHTTQLVEVLLDLAAASYTWESCSLTALLWPILTRRQHLLTIASGQWAPWGQGRQYNPWSSAFSSQIFPSSNSYITSPSGPVAGSISPAFPALIHPQFPLTRQGQPNPCVLRRHKSIWESVHGKGNSTLTISVVENITMIWMKHSTKWSTGAEHPHCGVPNLTSQVFPPENF